jgi:hypothetical protein
VTGPGEHAPLAVRLDDLCFGLDGEAQFAEDGDSAGFAAFEVGGSEALAGGELVSGAQDRLGRVTALVADQVS